MKYRLITCVLLLAGLGALAALQDSEPRRPSAAPAAASQDDASMKSLKIN